MNIREIIQQLHVRLTRLDKVIAELETLHIEGSARRSTRGRKSMGEAERRQVSARMKKYWAARRKHKSE